MTHHQRDKMNQKTVPSKDQNQQQMSFKEMVRAHAYPVLTATNSISLLAITILLIPQAVKIFRYNSCVDAQINMRQEINPQIQNTPGKLHYLKAIEHCEGR